MFSFTTINIYLFILLFMSIFVNLSSSAYPDCTQWQEFCSAAQKQTNPRFKCIDGYVYYYENEDMRQPWDKARQLCSLKFYGSYDADLVELSEGIQMDSAIKMLSNEMLGLSNPETEITTNGVCCMMKEDGPIPSSKYVCQWLKSGQQIVNFKTKGDQDSCQILTVKFNKNTKKFNNELINRTKTDPYPYLCQYKAPIDCSALPTEPPTLPPTTSSIKKSEPTQPHNTDVTQSVTKSPTNEPTRTHPIDTKNCNYDGSYDGKYNIPQWTPVAPQELSINQCPDGYNNVDNRKAVWLCGNDSRFDINGPHINCTKPWIIDLDTKVSHDINNSLNINRVLLFSNNLRENLKKEDLNFFNDLFISIRIIKNLQYLMDSIDDFEISLEKARNFSYNIVESCSHLLNKTNVWNNIRSDEKIALAENILQYIQSSAFTLGCNRSNKTRSQNEEIVMDNIYVKAFAMDYLNSTVFNAWDYSILVPAGINNTETIIPNCVQNTAIGAVFDKISTYLSAHLNDSYHKINSNVIAFSHTNDNKSYKLPDGLKVKIIVKHLKRLDFGDKVLCVFWDFHKNDWSGEGCSFEPINSNRQYSICKCDHLTNFAALMDVSGQEKPSTVKNILTIVCSIISSISLLSTIGFLTLVRALRNRRSTITCNLCICLLIANILVAFGMDKTDNSPLCQTISALILYSLLSSFSWMLMEGYHLYQMIVLVFSNIGHLRLVWLYAIGYGAPLVIFISAILGIGFDGGLQGEYFCWISSSYHPYRIWALAGPATFVVLANCLIMFLAIKAAFSAKIKKSEPNSISDNSISQITSNSMASMASRLSTKLSWMKGYISLVVLMGVTWISYVFYIHEYGSWFSYAFILLNGLQGFFIFTLQILLNEKARQVMHKYKSGRRTTFFSSLYKTTSTNVFPSMRSKSLSTGKVFPNSSNSPNCSDSNRVSVANSSRSHTSQSISVPRIRNVSDSILT